MKKIVFASTSAAALLLASSVFAAGNSTTIDQIGYANAASVDQTGSPSGAVAQITQGLAATEATDEYNSASVVQGGGAGNQADITQSQGTYGATRNHSNISSSDQQGADGGVTVVQVGDSTSTINQLSGSSNEHAIVGQSNVDNTSSITQSGARQLALVNQEEGGGNSATIIQAGTGNGVYSGYLLGAAPSGPGNLLWHENLPGDSVIPGASSGVTEFGPVGAFIDQTTANNTGTINQNGFDNFADVAQGNQNGPGNSNDVGVIAQGAGLQFSEAVVYQQDGVANNAAINQSGAGSAYSTILQNGNANQADSTQLGSERSIIGQGITNDEGRAGPSTTVFVSNDYASADQTGGADYSLINQTGNNDSATVSQVAAGASALVNQGGSFNVATIHQ